MSIETLGLAGGLFSLLALNHFVIDWGFQTHKEAMRKTSDHLWRAWHCLVYSAGFIPLLALMGFDASQLAAGLSILFVSHFIEDTYIPVYLWAKHIRCIPSIRLDGVIAFRSEFRNNPLHMMLFICVDQIIHLLFLLPLVYMAI